MISIVTIASYFTLHSFIYSHWLLHHSVAFFQSILLVTSSDCPCTDYLYELHLLEDQGLVVTLICMVCTAFIMSNVPGSLYLLLYMARRDVYIYTYIYCNWPCMHVTISMAILYHACAHCVLVRHTNAG
jgi:hypothetical protein